MTFFRANDKQRQDNAGLLSLVQAWPTPLTYHGPVVTT